METTELHLHLLAVKYNQSCSFQRFIYLGLICDFRTPHVFRKYIQIKLILDCFFFLKVILSLAINCTQCIMHIKTDIKWMWLYAPTWKQTAFAAQLRLLRLSWKWLRKREAARTSNMFPALPPGQDFQTYRGSDKDEAFSINCYDAFLQREHSSTVSSSFSERFYHYPPPTLNLVLTKIELKGVVTDILLQFQFNSIQFSHHQNQALEVKPPPNSIYLQLTDI